MTQEIVNTALKQSVFNYIKDHPYCDIDGIVNMTGILKNRVSRILHQFEDAELIEYTHDPNSYGIHNSEGGASFGINGWILCESKDRNGSP